MIQPSRGLAAAARMVPRDARRVVEITPAGGIAAVLRRWEPAAEVTAVEVAGLAGAAAGAPYDAVVLDEGLLALPAPVETLRAIRPLLAPAAPLLAVLPDRGQEATAALPALFGAAGLTLDIARRVPPPADGDTAAAPLVVVRAVAAGAPLRRLFLHTKALRPVGALNDKRVGEPAAFLETLPGVQARIEIDSARPQRFPGDGIFILQRALNVPEDVPVYGRLVDHYGYLLVSEFDDHPSRWELAARHDHLSFRLVHGVQTSTDVLAAELARHNPEVAVFPNCIAELPPERPAPAPDAPVTVFFGALNREEDWAPLLPAVLRLIAEFGDRLRFEVVHDRAFFDALPTERKAFTPTCPYATYLAVLGRCDVALLPLADGLFNRCKSDLKFVECAAYGVAALASPVVYRDSLRDGETGLLFDDAAAFEDGLRRLIGDAGLRARLTAAARAWVVEHRLLARTFRRRYTWYQSLLARRDALSAARAARLQPAGAPS